MWQLAVNDLADTLPAGCIIELHKQGTFGMWRTLRRTYIVISYRCCQMGERGNSFRGETASDTRDILVESFDRDEIPVERSYFMIRL